MDGVKGRNEPAFHSENAGAEPFAGKNLPARRDARDVNDPA